ncbi:MAG: YlxM family DNA-binding protein [Oscillospiraceae bacterium]|nr:YlxM family DNA-binding protein [Oscillospiraceae bacterium]
MLDDTLRRTMLFDFFGELLTEKQREYFDLHYNEDLSLAEIAQQHGVTRQGVWDIIKRAETTLLETEEKTGLIRKYEERRELIARTSDELCLLRDMTNGKARELTDLIHERLEELKNL